MDLKGIMLSERSQKEKDKYYIYTISLIYEIQKIKLVNITKKKDSQIQRTNSGYQQGENRGRGNIGPGD